MTTAVEPTATATPPAPPRSGGSLLFGSLAGAAVIFAGVVAAGYVSTTLLPETLPYIELFRVTTFLLIAALGVVIAGRIAALNPARGLSGGIILTVSGLIATGFVVRAFADNLEGIDFGPYVTAAVAALCLFGVFRMLTSQTGTGWAVALDDQGWADFHSHKRSQGQHVRRYTMIGVLLVGLTGAWSVFANQAVGAGPAAFTLPYTTLTLPLLPARELVVPLLIVLATLWVAWRLTNMPPFADFLIATEAEMNKVSWTSRKRLIQDTIVVLVTVVLLTLFLLVIDLFWGWLLSRKYIEVLPSKEASQQLTAPDGGMKLNW